MSHSESEKPSLKSRLKKVWESISYPGSAANPTPFVCDKLREKGYKVEVMHDIGIANPFGISPITYTHITKDGALCKGGDANSALRAQYLKDYSEAEALERGNPELRAAARPASPNIQSVNPPKPD